MGEKEGGGEDDMVNLVDKPDFALTTPAGF